MTRSLIVAAAFFAIIPSLHAEDPPGVVSLKSTAQDFDQSMPWKKGATQHEERLRPSSERQ